MKQKLDALIVLGGGIIPFVNSARANAAAQYYHDISKIPIITTGYKPSILKTIQETEAETLKRELLRRNVPPEDIITEEESQNTYQNLEFSLKHIKELGAENIGIITNRISMGRALKYAKKIFQTNYTPHPVHLKYETPEAILSEILTMPWEIRGIIKESNRR